MRSSEFDTKSFVDLPKDILCYANVEDSVYLFTPLGKCECVPLLEDGGLSNQLNRLFGYLSLFASSIMHVVYKSVTLSFVLPVNALHCIVAESVCPRNLRVCEFVHL